MCQCTLLLIKQALNLLIDIKSKWFGVLITDKNQQILGLIRL